MKFSFWSYPPNSRLYTSTIPDGSSPEEIQAAKKKLKEQANEDQKKRRAELKSEESND